MNNVRIFLFAVCNIIACEVGTHRFFFFSLNAFGWYQSFSWWVSANNLGIVFCFLFFLIFYLEAESFTCWYYMHGLEKNNKISYELKIQYDCLAFEFHFLLLTIESSLFLYRDQWIPSVWLHLNPHTYLDLFLTEWISNWWCLPWFIRMTVISFLTFSLEEGMFQE